MKTLQDRKAKLPVTCEQSATRLIRTEKNVAAERIHQRRREDSTQGILLKVFEAA